MYNNTYFNLNLFSKYRTELMGVATILILLCHAKANGVALHPAVMKVFELGQTGVQMFLFLSGIGLFYSLNGKDIGVAAWYKKRFVRLFTPYIMICGCLYTYRLLQGESTIACYLLRLTTLGYWSGDNAVAWFVAVLVPFYLLTPLLLSILSIGKYRHMFFIVLFALPVAIHLVVPTNLSATNNIVAHFVQAVSALQAFVAGLYVAPLVRQQYAMSLSRITLLIAAIVILFVFSFIITGLKPYWLFMLLLFGVFSVLLDMIPRKIKMLSFLGGISLESYLLNTSLPGVYNGGG